MMAGRAIENMQDDFKKLRTDQPLIEQAVIGKSTG